MISANNDSAKEVNESDENSGEEDVSDNHVGKCG